MNHINSYIFFLMKSLYKKLMHLSDFLLPRVYILKKLLKNMFHNYVQCYIIRL